nr:methyltransferase domain-containing protein [Gordonia sp. LAM0048]
MGFDVAANAYDRFMGRYSRPLARALTEWLEITPGQRVLDVGCGPGAWTARLVERLGADHVAAVDPSEPFVDACREAYPGVDVRRGVAAELPYADATFDACGACLVVHFMPDPVSGLAEMGRVTRTGGWVGATVWDLAGSREPMAAVWAVLRELDPAMHDERGLPGGREEQLAEFFTVAGLDDVETTEIPVTVTHPDFDEWWEPHLHTVGPIGETIATLSPGQRERLRDGCHERLGDGPFDVTAVAFGARARAR